MSRFSEVSVNDQSIPVDQLDVILVPDAAFTVGQVVMCPAGALGSHETCTTPTTASLGAVSSAIVSDEDMGVVKEILPNGNLLVCMSGKVDAITLSTSDASIPSDGPFIPNTSKQLELDVSAVNVKFVALATATVATGSVDTTVPTARTVWFDGMNGFGRYGGTSS